MVKSIFAALMVTVFMTAHAMADTTQLHRVVIAPQATATEVVVSTATYQPGESIARHSHHGIEALYVIKGARVELPNGKQVALKTGANLLNLRDQLHAGFKVVGDSALKIYTVHVVDMGKPLYVVKPAS